MNLQAAVSSLLLMIFCFISITTAQIEWKSVPADQAVVNRSDVRLDCMAGEGGGLTLEYTWKFNGSTIQTKTSLFANHSLLIPRFMTSDEGLYECTVSTVRSDNSSQYYSESKTALVIIAYINRFMVNPNSTKEPVNTTITFECITGLSAPMPEVYWNLNGQRLVDGVQLKAVYGANAGLARQVSMKLKLKMEKKYKGILRCIAVNTVLEKHVSSSDASIFLAQTPSLPVIVVPPPREVIVPVNSSLVLNCLVEGYKARTLWFKNDRIIDGTSTSYIHNNGSMIFVRVLLEDSGIYFCQGKNTVGTVTSPTVNLTVTVINVDFEEEPSDAMIFAGQSLTLNCIPPISVPPAKVTWYKNNQPVVLDPRDGSLSLVAPEEGIWHLHFTSVQAADEGDYACVAENPFAIPTSRTSRVATVTVQGAPIFIEPPLSQRVIRGRLLQLICRVQGSPTPTVTWLYDGTLIHPSNKISFRNNNQELWITNVDKSHEGTYTCVTENIFGRKTFNSSVKVIVPPVTMTHFDTIVVTSGHTAILPCDVYGDPKPSVQWFKDSKLVQVDDRRYIVDLSLHVDNVTSSDAGTYNCRAHNEAGTTWANGSLTVLVPPRITVGPSDTVVVIGQTALFPCSTEGVPKAKIQWLFNSTRYLPEGVSFLSDRVTVRITSVDWQHVGKYTCVASNSVGLDSQTGILRLKVPPSIYNISGRSVVNKGQTIQIECVHKGTPTPSVVWSHKGEIIQETLDGRITFPTRSMLRIKFSTKADAGEYSCKITNDVGTDTKSVRVYVIEPPNPPILTNVIPLSKSSVHITWIPNSQEPKTNVTGYAVSYKKRPETTFYTFPGRLPSTYVHYEVENLHPGTEYTFTVSAENSAGLGLPSNALSVTTLESGPSEPVNLRILSTNARSVRMSWQVPQQQNGNIRKYQVQYREREMSNSIITEYDVEDILNPSLPRQEYELSDLHPNTQYVIRVRAANVQHERDLWGPFSLILNVTTLIAAPSSGPRNITATALSPHIIKVQWQPPAPWEQNGPISGYRVQYKQQYQSVNQEIHVLASASEVNLTELSPWKVYFLVMEAENPAGRSPPSSPLHVQTLPTAPMSSPSRLHISVISSTVIAVSWQIPQVQQWTCEISGSIIQYKTDIQTGWDNITVAGTTNSAVNISNLTPWSVYRIRVALFSKQISPGVGPFSDAKEAKTLSGLPGAVRNLNVQAFNASIAVYWSPPSVLNGELQHYRVTYYSIGHTVAANTGDEVQALPGVSTNQKGPLLSLLTDSENATITGLSPDTLYNVSVSMATSAGEGPVESSVISTIASSETTTEPAPPPPPDLTTDATLNTTSNMLTDPGGGTNRNLPVIVAGSLTGGIFLLVILAIIIWRCLKKRRAGRDHYMKSMVSGVRIIKRGSGNYDRQILDPANIGEDDTVTYNNNNDDDNVVHQRYGSFNSHQPVPQSPSSVTSNIDGAAPPSPGTTKKSGSFLQNIRNSFSGGPVFAISSGADPGFDNPSYFDEHMSATLPRTGHPSMTAEEVYSQAEKTQRKNRMRSESAAAIAVMRSSGNLAIASDDTDTLINNEAVVVYNERTAL